MRNLLVVAVAFVALFNAACSGGDRPAQSDDSVTDTSDEQSADDDAGTSASSLSTVCDTEHVGCPCTTEGAVFACGRVKRTSGTYVSCTEGFSTCESGVWGKCLGSNVIAPTK